MHFHIVFAFIYNLCVYIGIAKKFKLKKRVATVKRSRNTVVDNIEYAHSTEQTTTTAGSRVFQHTLSIRVMFILRIIIIIIQFIQTSNDFYVHGRERVQRIILINICSIKYY